MPDPQSVEVRLAKLVCDLATMHKEAGVNGLVGGSCGALVLQSFEDTDVNRDAVADMVNETLEQLEMRGKNAPSGN